MMDPKPFKEVFPQLKSSVSDSLLSFITVNRLAYSKDRKFLYIYADLTRLIDRESLLRMERAVTEQFLSDTGITAQMILHFSLPDTYTLSAIVDEYRDSLVDELAERNPLYKSFLKKSVFRVEEEQDLIIELEDNPLVRLREKDWKAHFQEIFRNRFDYDIHVMMAYTGAYEPKLIRNHPDTVTAVLQNDSTTDAERPPFDEDVRKDDAAEAAAAAEDGKDAAPKKEASKKETPKKEDGKKGVTRASGKLNAGSGKGPGTVRTSKVIRSADDPNLIYGRNFDDEIKSISSYGVNEEGTMAVKGCIIATDVREMRNGERSIFTFAMTDYTDSIQVKLFVANEDVETLTGKLKKGQWIRLKGLAQYDTYDKEVSIRNVQGITMTDPDDTRRRMDNALEKRVELHCHSKFSEKDGLADLKGLLDTARGWGHKAMALTDHGYLYGFPEAYHYLRDRKISDFKVIYGVEGYLVDDTKQTIVRPENRALNDTCVVFDLETTGLSPVNDRIIEIGAVKIENGQVIDRFSSFVDPGRPIPFRIENLTGISDAMVKGAGTIEEILPRFRAFIGDAFLVAHNAEFDVSFLSQNLKQCGIPFEPFSYADTLGIAHAFLRHLKNYTLDTVAKELNVVLENHHRAVDDAECCAMIFLKFIRRFREQDITLLKDAQAFIKPTPEEIRKMHSHHVIILVKNETGRVNLYRTVSDSLLTYYGGRPSRPRIPKSLLQERREGLIIGSACSMGELFNAVLEGQTAEEIERIVSFYDFLEVQPIGNNQYLYHDNKFDIRTPQDLQALNRKIVELGEYYHKPVCATGDVHFIDPEDSIYRTILQAGSGYKESEETPLYFRTTDEMLEEFSYLGAEKAYEIVVKNTNMIADQVEVISPVRPDKCPPVIENADVDLKNACFKKAHEIYGDPLPPIVEERLNKELTSIIGNGYAVMYMIAEKLVSKSVSDGYLVGSRGSVGSSLAATMSGITEVNPLKPHYVCPHCHYSDFDSDEVNAYEKGAGCDMPDKLCPVCKKPLKKDGFNIPFETFLGFKGDKEPDIDLNFSGEYQSKAHAYTEVIFGKGQTFRAGTIGTVAEKTAIGYALHYFEEQGIQKRRCEIERLAKNIEGVLRTSGQHPGGIVVLPIGEDINTFTPIQHPANDQTTNIVTTHFEYHSIDHNLLKLDLLGHDDPTMIRMLQDLTGVDPRQFPLDSPEVMQLFKDTSSLGITPEDIRGCKLGALGVPEFGTDFAMNMVLECKPQHLSDLVRIAGMAHGTDVWTGNNQVLINSGQATIQTAICCRDDIMEYLISQGMDPAESFTIMESVRKGKGLKPGWEKDMVEHQVPDWYIWSCKKIKYMFPKAHAAAYVMMAWRIAYCKVFYPLEYYCAYFSIRADGFNYEKMAQGKGRIEEEMDAYERVPEHSAKEELEYRDMRITQEFYARGFDFVPIDVMKVQSTLFTIVDKKHLMPSLTSIDGMGEIAADTVIDAREKGPFTSIADFRNRTKVSQTLIDQMQSLHILSDLPQDDQLSLFDAFSMR